ncbi:hypothetical protein [Candidatus Phyllobacterium onerii]|jgi:hypothetical protein|uniref:hypothetical protein n=1 Tax=Candidatus Phyllobacterium onerii TaxID=3020828 RepID=UPI00232E1A77|nr:hypothetical protein [Phyllobacterium sp. IY22]
MEIKWQKTRVGLEEQAQDFTATNRNGIDVGRVHRIDGGPESGLWCWKFLLGHSQFRLDGVSGVQSSRQLAASQVRKTYERYLETPGSEGGGLSRIPLKKTANNNGNPPCL